MSRPREDINTHSYPVFRTTLVIAVRDSETGRELFDDSEKDDEKIDRIVVLDQLKDYGLEAKVMSPDLPRSRRYWKVSFPDLAPKLRIQVFGGASYNDITMDVVINNKKRFVNVLIILERRREQNVDPRL